MNKLNENKYCTLSTVCEDGQPWGSPVFFVVDEAGNIYWWSPVNSVHSNNIRRTGSVFVTVFDSGVQEGKGQALYMQCEATELENDEAEEARLLYNKKAKFFKLEAKDILGEAPTRIYCAKPKKKWRNVDAEENGYFIDAREEVE